MQTVSATDLARNTREILDNVANGGQTVAVERNQVLIATIMPALPTMTAAQAFSSLPLPMLTAAEAAAWLKDSRDESFDNTIHNPWA